MLDIQYRVAAPDDIEKQQLYVGIVEKEIAVIYVLNQGVGYHIAGYVNWRKGRFVFLEKHL